MGAGAGGIAGRLEWSAAWPQLSLLNALRLAALGWLAGAVGSAAVIVLTRRRDGWTRRARGRVARAFEHGLMLAALAPLGLWMTALPSDGVLRRATPAARLLGDHRPNVIIIGIDALRADHVGSYGSAAGLTPNLDAFAAEATRYDAACAAAPWTLCSLAAAFTSLPPSQSATLPQEGEDRRDYANRARLLRGTALLPERLREAGYVTAAEVTNPFLALERGWGRGFEHFRNEDVLDADVLLTSDTTRAPTVTARTCEWLRLNHGQPFFLWLHYLDPHTPYDSPETPDALRARYAEQWETTRTYWQREVQKAPAEVRARYQEFCRAMYAEEVRYADKWVGEVLMELKRLGLYDSSLIIVTADHGEELFDHGGFEHGHSMHEEVLWVPLLVKWPEGAEAADVVHQTVGLEDLAPTVLELAEAKPLENAWGDPLPRRDGEPGRAIYSEGILHGPEQTALTSDAHKLIYHVGAGGEMELYDRRRDRAECSNLFGIEEALGPRTQLLALTEQAAEARARQQRFGTERLALDDHTRRRLESLGYLSD